MPRIRSIKPGYFTSPSIAGPTGLPKLTRLTYIGLWTYLDDEGRGVDNARLVKAAVWPLDDDYTVKKVEADLCILAETGRVIRYEIGGKRYVAVPEERWKEHQHPNRPTPSTIPAPPEATVTTHAPLSESAVSPHHSSRSSRGVVDVEERAVRAQGAPRTKATAAPDAFEVDDALRAWAAVNAPDVNLERETQRMLDHHRAKGTTFKDWRAGWRTWMSRAEEYASNGKQIPEVDLGQPKPAWGVAEVEAARLS